jgi:hypothetical protein
LSDRERIDVDINGLEDLKAAEELIGRVLQRIRLDSALLGLRRAADLPSIGRYPPIRLEPFMIAGAAMFALRYCPPRPFRKSYRPLPDSELVPFLRLVNDYLLADPLSFDETIQEDYYEANPVFTFLRFVASQFPYNVGYYGQYARSLILYEELPPKLAGRPGVPRFDLPAAFEALNGVSLTDFVKAGFVAWVAARSANQLGFSRSYFDKARAQGMELPPDGEVLDVLGQLATTQEKFVAEYEQRKNADRRFGMYDFNPLLSYPIVRPFESERIPRVEEDALVAPLPDLLLSRLSVGVFYQVFNRHKEEFSRYFGHLLGEYVGIVMRNSVSPGTLVSEEDIRKTYPDTEGKVPDWAVVDGTTAVLVECKATRFARRALAMGDEGAVNEGLKQVMKGLKQLDEFIEACRTKRPGLERFHGCTQFKPVLTTLEPLYLVNSTFFREHIDGLLAEAGVTDLPWLILPIDEVERLQPHLAAGIDFGATIDELRDATFNEVLEKLHEQTNRVYKDSFLYPRDEQLFRSLGV